MNKPRIILILKTIISIAFVIAFVLAVSKSTDAAGLSKTMIIISGILGIIGFIISFAESASNSKKQKTAANQASEAESLIGEKNQEIEKITEEVREKTLLSERVAKLSRIIQEAEDIKLASASVLETLANEIEVCQGVLYVTDEKDGTKFLTGAGTYAYHKLDSDLDQPQFGVGLVGQTAQEKKSLYINELPTGYIDVVSGLGKAQPSFLSLIPLMYSGEVLGVIELASFTEFTDKDKALFEGIKDALGAGIHFLHQAKVLERLQSENEKLKNNTSDSIEEMPLIEEVVEEPVSDEELEPQDLPEGDDNDSEEEDSDNENEENND